MKKLILLVFIIHNAVATSAQKRIIDISILGKWPSVENPAISNDGKYFAYTIRNQPVNNSTLIIINEEKTWKKEFIINDPYYYFSGFFSADDKKLIFHNVDSLYIVELETDKTIGISNVASIKHPKADKGKWLAYQVANSSRELILLNLLNGKEQHFSSIEDYSFSDNGNILLLSKKKDTTHSLQWLNLTNSKIITIWSSEDATADACSFDANGEQLAFKVLRPNKSEVENSIWYYKQGMVKAILKANNQSEDTERTLSIAGTPQFSKNGRWIFFQLQQAAKPQTTKEGAVMVDIWSYKDLVLQPEQMRQLEDGAKSFSAVIGVNSNNIVRLEAEDECAEVPINSITGDYTVIVSNESNYEHWWNLSPQPSYYLVSLKDGSRISIKKESRSLHNFSFSPQGNYLVYYDSAKGHYYSFNLKSHEITNISRAIPTKVTVEYINAVIPEAVAGVAGWHDQDRSLLIYDNYDIWQVDPAGKKGPINISNGYGAKHQIKFRLVEGPTAPQDPNSLTFSNNKSLLLTAFNTLNKYNGFYRKMLEEKGDPELLIMGPYTYYLVESQKPHFFSLGDGMKPIKATSADAYIIKRQSYAEAPNLYLTKNFKNYIALSQIAPQKDYNWLSAELITWKMFDGRMSQGILYKPENFDSTKTYPLIFNYYEKLSHRLFGFPYPNFTEANIDIAYFVSNGYLVFTPDIHYEIGSKSGKPCGEWAYNSVVSAAQHLAKLPYVDSKKMAIQGHSFGGLETNYIATHTDLFAAAAEAAGVTDPISEYLTLAPFRNSSEHFNTQIKMERGHELYGTSPWEQPDLYQENSAVLNANKVTSPLLIMHNKIDNNIQWRQGVELYMALRRLGKKVWMLQYDNSGHTVRDKDAIDYTIRLTQFFDHYLKETPPPKWMTKGIPASLKGIETGYDIDTQGTCSKNCPICNKITENKEIQSLTP